jgi:hypothetical protein
MNSTEIQTLSEKKRLPIMQSYFHSTNKKNIIHRLHTGHSNRILWFDQNRFSFRLVYCAQRMTGQRLWVQCFTVTSTCATSLGCVSESQIALTKQFQASIFFLSLFSISQFFLSHLTPLTN